MTRDTSIDAYHEIRDSGLLSELRFRVYEWLFHNGPSSVRECCESLGLHTHNSARFNELEAHGVAKRIGRAPGVVGTDVDIWDVTSELPKKPPAKVKFGRPEKTAALKSLRFALARMVGEQTYWDTLPADDQTALKTLGLWLKQQVEDGS